MNRPLKIMIVEDEVIIAICLEMELESAGYEILGYKTTGEDAIEAIKQNEPDLILMDIHLSGVLDGIDTALELRKFTESYIIFMTGFDKDEIFAKTLEIEKVTFLEKPVEVQQVKNIIKKEKVKPKLIKREISIKLNRST